MTHNNLHNFIKKIQAITMAFPVEEKFIIETEEKMQVKFPLDYRTSMMEKNGGEIGDGWNLFPFYDASDKKRIKRTCNNLIYENNVLQKLEIFPKDAIAIADDGDGNYLVLIKQENKTELKNNVFLWHHEMPDQLQEISEKFSQL